MRSCDGETAAGARSADAAWGEVDSVDRIPTWHGVKVCLPQQVAGTKE